LTDSTTNNIVNYNFNDAFVGLHYKVLLGKITITPGFSQHFYSMNNEQLASKVTNSFNKILPDLYVLYQIKKLKH